MKAKRENRLVVGDASWADILPEWLLDEVRAERMILGLVSIARDIPDCDKVGDAELVAYLMPASMRAPIGHNMTQIYLYLTTKLMEKRGTPIPDDVRVDKLNSDQERELKDLRYTIYTQRGRDIQHPLLEAMRVFKKEVGRKATKRKVTKRKATKDKKQISLFEGDGYGIGD